MKPKCRVCGALHWLSEGHVFASNSASNAASNKGLASNNASNRKPEDSGGGVGGVGGSIGDGGAVLVAAGGVVEDSGVGNKQRWNREAYNAYMREYMRRRRAIGGH